MNMKKKKKDDQELLGLHQTLRWRLTIFVFAIMVISGLLTASFYLLVILLFARTPVVIALTVNPLFLGIVLLCISAMIGTLLSVFFGKMHLRPIKLLSDASLTAGRGMCQELSDASVLEKIAVF